MVLAGAVLMVLAGAGLMVLAGAVLMVLAGTGLEFYGPSLCVLYLNLLMLPGGQICRTLRK